MLPKILFVDDELNVLNAHKRSFRAYNNAWNIRYANSGEDALSAFSEDPADVVITDLAMPHMKGLALVAEIKKMLPETVCIILTGTGDMQSALHAINEVDVFRYYLKPCQAEDLARGITDAIATKIAGGDSLEQFDIGKTALDRLPYGVFVLAANARVMFMNAFARELIKARDGLFIGHDQVLRASRPAETQALHTSIRNATETKDSSMTSGAMFVERINMLRPLHCVVQNFISTSNTEEHEPHAAIYVTDPERAPEVSAPVLAGLFDLTPSESRLLAGLVFSGRLDQAAEDANLTLSTARTYLKQIFAKTGTGRQGELIQLVLLSPAVIKPSL